MDYFWRGVLYFQVADEYLAPDVLSTIKQMKVANFRRVPKMSIYGMAQPTSEVTLPKSPFRLPLVPSEGLLMLTDSIAHVSGDGSRSGVSDGWEEEAQQCIVGEFAGWAGSGGQRPDLLSQRAHACGPAHMCALLTDAPDRGQSLLFLNLEFLQTWVHCTLI